MPRRARLDVPGAIHHVMGRGIERRAIFLDDVDREDFLSRLERLVEKKALVVYAWALMPNHFHLLVRSTLTPLSRAMRSLMTGYAGYFNRKHERVGHLFQNRFKSVLCEEETYLLELVRYIHLNPVRAGIENSLDSLERSSATGHSVLLKKVDRPWQDRNEVLRRFSRTEEKARKAYRSFMEDGLGKPVPGNLEGGGLVRSFGGWGAVASLRRGREHYRSDERVLGGSDFVEGLLIKSEEEEGNRKLLRQKWPLGRLLGAVCERVNVPVDTLGGNGKDRKVALAREGVSYLWVKGFRMSGGELARETGMKPITVYLAAKRGEIRAQGWMSWLSGK